MFPDNIRNEKIQRKVGNTFETKKRKADLFEGILKKMLY